MKYGLLSIKLLLSSNLPKMRGRKKFTVGLVKDRIDRVRALFSDLSLPRLFWAEMKPPARTRF